MRATAASSDSRYTCSILRVIEQILTGRVGFKPHIRTLVFIVAVRGNPALPAVILSFLLQPVQHESCQYIRSDPFPSVFCTSRFAAKHVAH